MVGVRQVMTADHDSSDCHASSFPLAVLLLLVFVNTVFAKLRDFQFKQEFITICFESMDGPHIASPDRRRQSDTDRTGRRRAVAAKTSEGPCGLGVAGKGGSGEQGRCSEPIDCA